MVVKEVVHNINLEQVTYNMKRIIVKNRPFVSIFWIILFVIIFSCNTKEQLQNKTIEVELDTIYFHKRVEWMTTKPKFIELSLKVSNKTDSLFNYNLLNTKSIDSLPRFYIKSKYGIEDLIPRENRQETKGALKPGDSLNWIFELKTADMIAISLREMDNWFKTRYANNSQIVLRDLGQNPIKLNPNFKNINSIYILDLERISKNDTLKMKEGELSPEELKKLFEKTDSID